MVSITLDREAFLSRPSDVLVAPFLEEFRAALSDEHTEHIEAFVAEVFSDGFSGLSFQKVTTSPLQDDLDKRIFDALVSQPNAIRISIEPPFDSTLVAELLDYAIPKMSNLQSFFILLSEMEESHVNVFQFLRRIALNGFDLGVSLKTPNTVATEALFRLLSVTDKLHGLVICTQGHSLQTGCLEALCKAISESPSRNLAYVRLELLAQSGMGNTFSKVAAGYLAKALMDRRNMTLGLVAEDSSLTVNDVCNALARTSAARSFDICFKTLQNVLYTGPSRIVPFPWKTLLGDDNIPLNYWPRILEKAGRWNETTSHTAKDVLFFLLKEKPDVLLQNVKLPKLVSSRRKRKHDQTEGT